MFDVPLEDFSSSKFWRFCSQFSNSAASCLVSFQNFFSIHPFPAFLHSRVPKWVGFPSEGESFPPSPPSKLRILVLLIMHPHFSLFSHFLA